MAGRACLMQFFKHESCGQCTPCRSGTEKAAQLMTSAKPDTALLKELSQTMADASICGLGQTASNPLISVMKHFQKISRPLLTSRNNQVAEMTKQTEIDRFTIEMDGKKISASADKTIWQIAREQKIDIPHLCYKDDKNYRADGNCRACMVEIEGERVLAASCQRKASPGMKITTNSARAKTSRKMVMELLLADQPARTDSHDPNSHLWQTADKQDIATSRFAPKEPPQADSSHPAIAVNMDACIQCNLCVRACREVQVNDVIGLAGRGADARIIFDFDDDMGASTCVGCGECVQACPTGALMPKTLLADDQKLAITPDSQVNSVCPYCGVGCQLTFNVKDDKIVSVNGRSGPANNSRLCVKGRYGFDYIHNPERLTQPLIRRADVPKSASCPLTRPTRLPIFAPPHGKKPWTMPPRALWR